MPEKPIISRVGPIGAWSTGRVVLGARRLGGFQCEGFMDLGEKY